MAESYLPFLYLISVQRVEKGKANQGYGVQIRTGQIKVTYKDK